MFDTLKLQQITEICKSRGKKVTLMGGSEKRAHWLRDYLCEQGFEVAACDNREQIPLFSTVVALESENICNVHNCLRNTPQYPEFQTASVNSIVDADDMLGVNIDNAHELPTDVFVLTEGDVIRYSAKNSTVLDDYQRRYFKNEILGCCPDLEEHRDKIYVVYAGATPEITITRQMFDHAVEDVRRGFRLGFSKIVFYNGDETMQQPSLLSCQRVAEFLSDEIAPDSLFYFCSGLESQEYYDQVFDDGQWQYRMHMITALRFERAIKSHGCIDNLAVLREPYEVRTKSKNYVCFNRIPRWHRVSLLSMLLTKRLVDDSYYSFDLTNLQIPNCPEHVKNRTMLPINSLKHRFPMVLNRSKDNDNPVSIHPDDVRYHKNSYFSVVTETAYYSAKYSDYNDITHGGTTFFSEKIFKPLAYKHPFILVSTHGSLAQLRGFGYKTFAPYIDESYDDIVDDIDRMKAIVTEIQRLCSQSTEEWLEWQKNIASVVEYNFEWLCSDKNLCVTKNMEKYFN